jgi:hypothetical protein
MGELKLKTANKVSEGWASFLRKAIFAWEISIAGFGSQTAQAASNQDPTLSLGVGAGYLTHKSKLVESNDTAVTPITQLEILAGQGESLLVAMQYSTHKTAFALNKAKIESSQLFGVLGYQGSLFQLGLGAGTESTKVTLAEGAEGFDTTATYAVATFGLGGELFRGSDSYLKVWAGYPIKVTEASKQTVKMSLLIKGDVGVKFPLTKKALSLMSGYSYSTQTVTFSGKANSEIKSFPYLGILLGLDL